MMTYSKLGYFEYHFAIICFFNKSLQKSGGKTFRNTKISKYQQLFTLSYINYAVEAEHQVYSFYDSRETEHPGLSSSSEIKYLSEAAHNTARGVKLFPCHVAPSVMSSWFSWLVIFALTLSPFPLTVWVGVSEAEFCPGIHPLKHPPMKDS